MKRLVFWQITLAPTYALLVLLVILGASIESSRLGPYTTWYNQRLKAKATEAGLVGSSEARIQRVLGRADNIWRFWEALDPAGRPTASSRLVTTYEYYPYPLLPFSKFQAHCTEGVVRNLEMFDD